jgi:hypothetical protein
VLRIVSSGPKRRAPSEREKQQNHGSLDRPSPRRWERAYRSMSHSAFPVSC